MGREQNSRKNSGAGSTFLLVYVFLAAAFLAAGFLFYRNYEFHFRSEAERQLAAVAELKMSELVNWRRERLGDAQIFFQNRVFSDLVRRYFERPGDLDAQNQIRTWMSHFQAANRYERVMLLDSRFVKKMIVPDGMERRVSYASPRSIAGLEAGRVVVEDFYWNEENRRIYLKVFVPILERKDGGGPLAVLALRIDPASYLYPFLRRWPLPSLSAETLLIRRDGNDALYVSDLKFQGNSALKLRIPLSSKNVPAVMAVLGQEGIVEGRDYRGAPVFAFVHAIPDSPWFLEARIDRAEVFAPLRKRLLELILVVGALLLGSGAGLVWWHQSIRFYRERDRAREAIAILSSHQEALLSAIPDIIMEVDENKVYTWANQVGREFFGEDLVGKEAAFYFVGEQDTYDLVRPLFRGDESVFYMESWQRRRDGEKRLLAWWCRVLKDRDGNVTGAISSAHDITDIREAEKALQASEDKFKYIFEHSIVGKSFTLPGGEISVNKAFCDMLGYTADELKTRKWQELTHPDDVESTQKALDRILYGEQGSARFEKRYIHKNGSSIWADVSTTLRRDSDGRPIYFMTSVIDISKSKRAEAAQHESEEQFRSLYENSTIGIYRTNPAGKILLANPALVKMLGYSSFAELASRNLVEEGFEPSYPRQLFLEKFAEKDEVLGLEAAWKRRDGSVIHVREGTRAVRDAGGVILHFDGTVEDITERKLAEGKLRNSLAEKELLLKEVHHRVKNNLMTIIGLIKMQGTKANIAMFNPLLLELEGRVRAMALVHECLHKSEDLAHVDLQNYIETMSAHIRAQFGADRDIDLSVHAVGVDVGLDIAVPCGLILNELIANAYKYAFPGDKPGSGSGKCMIKATVDHEDGTLILTVADNGVGLPAGVNWKNPTTVGHQLVRMLSQQLNGTLKLDRSAGTCFSLKFPMAGK
jgi:PAS domain S-box-containing protein